ncbi:FISUMP domain-containing protein [Maribellus mangrovi]|uniref:FISUMP domain-containing protein n=1 Tax=Maribellus mangrovi TaxID=3133146 RepID=UPI0030EDFCB8
MIGKFSLPLPRGLNWKGPYNPATSYRINDAVGYDGSSYICISPTTGNDPTNDTYWDLLALKGTDGSDGQDGAAGADGADGLSAYQIWLNEGNSGTEQDFLDSLVGPAGADGADGADGTGGGTDLSDVKYSDYMFSENASELYTLVWKAEAYNERLGEFKATVFIRDRVTKTKYHLQAILGFDHLDDTDRDSKQSNVISDGTVTLTLSINAATNFLEATLSGMPTNNKVIHYCFERCVVAAEDVPLEFGVLYNNPAVKDTRLIAPSGYRVANIEDITGLLDYLGGAGEAGGELKATDGWNLPNTEATDSKGFAALPAGYRDAIGEFKEKLAKAKIWINNT